MNVKRYARGPVFWVRHRRGAGHRLLQRAGSGGSSYKSVSTAQVVASIDAGNVTNAVFHDKEQTVQLTLKTPLKDGDHEDPVVVSRPTRNCSR